ncbi:MAG: hypothetical protein PUB96_06260 [Helicobacteraceae bacterium]|nr:hypothetical protein [Helicobacteraceae bacterium]
MAYKDMESFEKDFKKSFESDLKYRFNAMYHNYFADDSFENRLQIKREFQQITGMEFSENALKQFQAGLNSSDALKYINTISNSLDYLKGMKLNNDGSISLDFYSGKNIRVNELYSGDGEFNVSLSGERASVFNNANSLESEGLNKLDFTQVGIKTNSGVLSLSQLGIDFVQKISFENGKSGFLLTDSSGAEQFVNDLYKITNINNMLKISETKEKFYPRFEK